MNEEKKEAVTISLLINILRVPSEDTESSWSSPLPSLLWLIRGDNGPLKQKGKNLKHLSYNWLRLNYTNKESLDTFMFQITVQIFSNVIYRLFGSFSSSEVKCSDACFLLCTAQVSI